MTKVIFFSVKSQIDKITRTINQLFIPGAAIKEFGPKSGRACNDLAWNPKFTNYLAAAYDKSRNDHSILIFDTSLAPPSQTEASSSAVAKIVSKSSTSKVRFIEANHS